MIGGQMAGMTGFRPSRRSYRAGPSEFHHLVTFEVAIDDVQPLNRKASYGVFNDVLATPAGPDRDLAIDAWCQDVWAAFHESRQTIVDLLREHGIT